MFYLKSAFLGFLSAILISNLTYADEIGHVPISPNNDPHTIYTSLGLKPISNSYKLAKLQFLPDLKDSETGWAGNKIGGEYNRKDCSTYPLTSTPKHANYSKCPVGHGYKINSCHKGYTLNSKKTACDATSCSALNSNYKSSVPLNQVCNKITESGFTCYKDCRNISCSGYSLNCDTFNVANSASKTTCPDCDKADANCSPKLCKVGSCQTGYKIADNGTTCVALDDTCPSGYYKSCETGTQGTPQYTEKGTACYQCKPKIVTCADKGLIDIDACHISGSTNYGSIKAWTPANMGL